MAARPRRQTPSPTEPVSELRRVPIRECGEPLIDLAEAGPRVRFAEHHVAFRYHPARAARQGLVQRLERAADSLPKGLSLLIVEGWRDPHIQKRMWLAAYDRFRREQPDWTEARLKRHTNRFSAPLDIRVPAPHLTGGAVDLHLLDQRGQPLDLTSPYDAFDQRAARFDLPVLSAAARRNRAMLKEILESVDITNYPLEFWHWSFGDPGWAYRGGHSHAVYGETRPEGWELHPEDAEDGPLPLMDAPDQAD